MRWGAMLFIGLMAGTFLVTLLSTMRATKRDSELHRLCRRVDSMLTVWAEHWGEPPEQVKAHLIRAIGDDKPS